MLMKHLSLRKQAAQKQKSEVKSQLSVPMRHSCMAANPGDWALDLKTVRTGLSEADYRSQSAVT